MNEIGSQILMRIVQRNYQKYRFETSLAVKSPDRFGSIFGPKASFLGVLNWIQKTIRKGAKLLSILSFILVQFSGPKREEVVLEKVHVA